MEILEDRTVPSAFSPSVFTDSNAAGVNSLRNAIIAANADPGTQPDTISLKSGTYKLTLKNTAGPENDARTGDLDITSTAHTLVIQGQGTSGRNKTVIDASSLKDRVFQIVNPGTTVEFEDLVIEGGLARDDGSSGATPGTSDALGGGILNDGGTLTLDHVLLTANRAVGAAGTSGATGKGSNPTSAVGGAGGDGGNAQGGGLFTSDGSVTLTDCVVSGNSAQGGHGGNGAASPKGPSGSPGGSGSGGAGGTAQGGGLYAAAGLVTLNGTTVSGNSVVGGNAGSNAAGSAISGSSVPNSGGDAAGGGLFSVGGTLTVSACAITGNKALSGQGGSSLAAVAEAGGDAGTASGGGVFAGGDSAAFVNTTVAGNLAQGGGGGAGGPGVVRHAGGMSGSSGVGGVVPGGRGGAGGYAQGGGLFTAGGTVTLTNATLAFNSAKGGAGGIGGTGQRHGPKGAASGGAGGGVGVDPGATVNLQNTLIAKNTAKAGPDYYGDAAATDHDLIGNGVGSTGFSTANGDDVGTAAKPVNPVLGPLQNNGGSTRTFALLPGSPAIDAGDNGVSPGDADQRGLPRIANGTIDIGATEYQADLAISIRANSASVRAGGKITYTLIVQNRGPETGAAIMLTDILPANTTFVSFTALHHWTKAVPAVGATGTVTASAAAGAVLNPGKSVTFTLVVRVGAGTPSGTEISNTATLAFAWDNASSNNSATRTIRVQ